MRYKVSTYATREGSAHMNNGEHRIYEVEADSEQAARLKAIEAVYAEGGLEHANPRTVTLIRE